MSQDYLLKTEPSEYSFADLQRDAHDRVGGRFKPGRREEPARNEPRREADYLRDRITQKRGWDRNGCFRGCFRSQKS